MAVEDGELASTATTAAGSITRPEPPAAAAVATRSVDASLGSDHDRAVGEHADHATAGAAIGLVMAVCGERRMPWILAIVLALAAGLWFALRRPTQADDGGEDTALGAGRPRTLQKSGFKSPTRRIEFGFRRSPSQSSPRQRRDPTPSTSRNTWQKAKSSV